MALTAQDRNLLRRCLNHESGAWNDFVDRYLGLVYHVIQHTAHLRSHFLQPEETEDIAADIMVELAEKDYAVLRQFRGNSSLASFLTVIARRLCVADLTRRHPVREAKVNSNNSDDVPDKEEEEETPRKSSQSGGLEALEEVSKLLKKLPARERKVVQLYFIEGRSYEEISTELNIQINNIGVILARARKKLRDDSKAPPPRVDLNQFKSKPGVAADDAGKQVNGSGHGFRWYFFNVGSTMGSEVFRAIHKDDDFNAVGAGQGRALFEGKLRVRRYDGAGAGKVPAKDQGSFEGFELVKNKAPRPLSTMINACNVLSAGDASVAIVVVLADKRFNDLYAAFRDLLNKKYIESGGLPMVNLVYTDTGEMAETLCGFLTYQEEGTPTLAHGKKVDFFHPK